MADIVPFSGLRYNRSVVNDLSRVICPPYDIISPALHDELMQRDTYNFVRIEDSRPRPRDNDQINRYTRAAATLQNWLQEAVLVSEARSSIYIDDHHFTLQGKPYVRRGIIARLRLEEWEKGIVKPHEGIIAIHRDDRLNLLWALQVNTSPVLTMYQDEKRALAGLLESQSILPPIIDVTLPEGDRHVIRAVADPGVLNNIQKFFEDRTLYIADGHHRYTSALTFKNEKTACTPGATGDDAFNFIMTTLIDFEDPGMIILAPHRALRGLPQSMLDAFSDRLQQFFEVTELPLQQSGVWDQIDRWQSAEGKVHLACLVQGAAVVKLLTLRDQAKMSTVMPNFHSDLYHKLDVSVVDHVILEKVLELGSGFSEEGKISYLYDRGDAVQGVIRGDYQVAFFLKPVSPWLIKEVADAGDKMPRKSTYFYPKAPAGLVVNPLY